MGSIKKTVQKRLVKKLKGSRSIADGKDSDPARGRSSGNEHASRAFGMTQRQAAGGYASPKRTYTNKDPRLIRALKEIQSTHQCEDEAGARLATHRGYARRRGEGFFLTPAGQEYIKHGRDY